LRKALVDKDKSEDKPDQRIAAGGVASSRRSVFGVADVWMTYSFAREWFEDALHEAKTGTDHNARRREMVFAVCFAESYLFEWVRDDIFDRKDFEKLVASLNQVFPPGQEQPVLEKWKDVPKKLLSSGLIPAAPNLGQPYWEEFRNSHPGSSWANPRTDYLTGLEFR
jgi:hypothetical protein